MWEKDAQGEYKRKENTEINRDKQYQTYQSTAAGA